jgi:DNA polymerase-3 subunit chi
VTRIDFHHGAADKLAAACRLIADFHAQGHRVVVYAPESAVAERIDRMLWSQPATGFLPHCSAHSPLAAQTPVLIAASLDGLEQDDVLVNLDGELPPSFSRFRHLVEIVGTGDDDKVPARARYKFYRDRGYPLHAHEAGRQ